MTHLACKALCSVTFLVCFLASHILHTWLTRSSLPSWPHDIHGTLRGQHTLSQVYDNACSWTVSWPANAKNLNCFCTSLLTTSTAKMRRPGVWHVCGHINVACQSARGTWVTACGHQSHTDCWCRSNTVTTIAQYDTAFAVRTWQQLQTVLPHAHGPGHVVPATHVSSARRRMNC